VTAVVDTNVLAYFLLRTARFVDESEQFLLVADDLVAPSMWEAELANALSVAVRHGVVSQEDAGIRLKETMRLGIRSVATRRLWQGGLIRAIESGLSVYDAVFVELAERIQAPLATFDGAILKAYPDLAARPSRLLPT
jgi:predicted nucleic acid-binding protein